MENSLSYDRAGYLSFVHRAYLSRLPVKHIFSEIPVDAMKQPDFQADLIKNTVGYEMEAAFRAQSRYRDQFVYTLVRFLEDSGADVIDDVYQALDQEISPPSEYINKVYVISENHHICLMEHECMVVHGTTGLVTWPASFYLAEWLLDHPSIVHDRRVLELGSGMGFLACVTSTALRPLSYIASDIHPVCDFLRENIQRNVLSGLVPVSSTQSPSTSMMQSLAVSPPPHDPSVSCVCINWDLASSDELARYSADVVLAADVAYDPDLAEPFLRILSVLFSLGVKEAFICYILRNPSTSERFLSLLSQRAQLSYEFVEDERPTERFLYNRQCCFKLLLIKAAATS